MARMWCLFAIRSPCYFAELQSRDERRLYRRGTSGELEASSPRLFGARRWPSRRRAPPTRSASYWEWIPLTARFLERGDAIASEAFGLRELREAAALRGVRAERLVALHVNVSLEPSLHDRGVGARRRGEQHRIGALLVGQPPLVGIGLDPGVTC